MSTPAFLLFCLCFGVLAAFAWLVWRYRGVPSLAVMRSDFERQWRESSRRGRLLYPLFLAGLLLFFAVIAGATERSVRGSVGFALGLGPLMLAGWLLPHRSPR